MHHWTPWLIIIGVPLAATTAFSIPPCRRAANWRRWPVIMLKVFLIVPLPLAVFVLSAFLTPDWKGGCRFGALDCFHAGKLALLPLVLWAMRSLYVCALGGTGDPSWRMPFGLLWGSLISTGCLIFGVITLPPAGEALYPFLLVPAYVSAWFAYHTALRWSSIREEADRLLLSLGVGSPLVALAVWLSRHSYDQLPEVRPGCFIVTAAAHGHGRFVGRTACAAASTNEPDNLQLARFRQFEAIWQRRHPECHRRFRRLYNFAGPVLAARITNAWAADATYVLLKPAEWLAIGLCPFDAAFPARKRGAP